MFFWQNLIVQTSIIYLGYLMEFFYYHHINSLLIIIDHLYCFPSISYFHVHNIKAFSLTTLEPHTASSQIYHLFSVLNFLHNHYYSPFILDLLFFNFVFQEEHNILLLILTGFAFAKLKIIFDYRLTFFSSVGSLNSKFLLLLFFFRFQPFLIIALFFAFILRTNYFADQFDLLVF